MTKEKGITLIALVITIIVMLILVAVTITMAVNGGLFDYASQAARGTKEEQQAEQDWATLRDNMSTDELIAKYTTNKKEDLARLRRYYIDGEEDQELEEYLDNMDNGNKFWLEDVGVIEYNSNKYIIDYLRDGEQTIYTDVRFFTDKFDVTKGEGSCLVVNTKTMDISHWYRLDIFEDYTISSSDTTLIIDGYNVTLADYGNSTVVLTGKMSGKTKNCIVQAVQTQSY